MFWELRREPLVETEEAGDAFDGRFVLHRHHDAEGPHLDLRLEHEGCCLGWRIDGVTLEEPRWAAEKPPQPQAWLDSDGEAVREDAGLYRWLERTDGMMSLEIHGRDGVFRVTAERRDGLPPETIRAVGEALREHGFEAGDAAALVMDGAEARKRALNRLCGLGRELDGTAFDEALWRRALEGAPLEDLHGHLRTYETRFDRKYPPRPVSRPEPLPEEEGEATRDGKALRIACGGGFPLSRE